MRYECLRVICSVVLWCGFNLSNAGNLDATSKIVVPTQGAYNGVYADFGGDEDDVSLEAIEKFATLVGKPQAIIGFGNNWGKGEFPAKQVRIIHNSGAIPLIFWYAREISNEVPQSKFNLESINAGTWDDYIDSWAMVAKYVGGTIMVSWGLEMNGNWYPWSGVNHGGGTVIPDSVPPRYQGPETYKQPLLSPDQCFVDAIVLANLAMHPMRWYQNRQWY